MNNSVKTAALASAVACALAASSPNSAVATTTLFDAKAYAVAYDNYVAAHPTDILGQARVAKHFGVNIESVSIPAVGVERMTPEAAQVQVDKVLSSGRSLSGAGTREASTAIIAATITDRFSVSGSRGTVPTTGQTVIQGNWNFDDAFVGSGGPSDIAALEFTPSFQVSNQAWSVYDYKGYLHDGDAYIYSTSPSTKSIALGINDKTSNFYTNYDHGSLRVFGWPGSSLSCSFQYEHNQGFTGMSVSVGWGFLSIGYSGSGDRGQRSTGFFCRRETGR